MCLKILVILIITIIIKLLIYKRVNRNLIIKIYFVIIMSLTIFEGIFSLNIILKSIQSLNLCICIIMIFFSIIIYIIDFFILNIIENNVLILDFKYYFRGKIDKVKFLISCLFAVMEEVVFRMLLIGIENNKIFFLLITSICFGIIHRFFSKYDCFSKFVLGMILGIISIMTENLIYPMMIHIIYNYLTLKLYNER